MRGRLVQVLVPVVVVLAFVVAVQHVCAQTKPPVPAAEVQEPAKKAATEIYGGRFRQAKTSAEKTALAAQLIEAASKVQDGSPDQYVLLKIAVDIAAGAGDAPTALQAVEKLVERFDVPGPKLTAETLLAVAGNATVTSQHKAVGEAALKIADALADAEEYELVLRLCESARSSAQKTRQYPLAKELTAKIEDFKNRQRAFQEYQAAWAVMDKDPAEPAANLAAGRYQCFVKGDWERGVPMLALGSDAALKNVSLMELRGAKSAEQQAAIGDAWWDAVETRQGEERDMLRLRAGLWYRQAEPRLTGLAALRIKQRLAELDKLGRQAPATLPAATAASAPAPAIAPFDDRTAKRHQTLWAKHLGVPVVHGNAIDMTFVLIPPGEFQMGSGEQEIAHLVAEAKPQIAPKWYVERIPAEAPEHRVSISRPFYLSVCEVTREQFQRLMGSNPSKFSGIANRPAEMVTWDDAVTFCRKLGELPDEKKTGAVYRLPTEAEWEYACRAGTTARHSFGDAALALGAHAWWTENSHKRTQPVGTLRPNAWGLFDMHGNVWEWTADWYAADYYAKSPAGDPLGPDSGTARVLRGGSWGDGYADVFRCASRSCDQPNGRYSHVGFRVARTIAP